ncbi:hypothetical protein OIDMADRAFT_146397 [Oidiodendron maius Zn]|uniref:Uncharacterized protein n=1 Tax=Oidiodendron maius (strain Zn) TaxID=913774 RepID=A0A0C3H9B4_OIDMZ|nr:hypothetical protein OIDMADRAFT_146397 [Oidiodendron maius Zn]
MTEARCIQNVAQKLAGLEGWRRVNPTQDFTDVTLDRLDGRVRYLEQLSSIDSPPPMLEATGESLAYRLHRLERPPAVFTELKISSWQTAAGEKLGIDLSALKALLVKLFNKSPEWPEEDEMPWISAASQQLCYAAGRHRVKPPHTLETISQLYAFAVELSLKMESIPPPPVPLIPYPKPRNPHHSSHACCGCCSCSCHKRLGRRNKCVNAGRVRWRRFPRFTWLKKLWCFKSKGDDDSSTIWTDADD